MGLRAKRPKGHQGPRPAVPQATGELRWSGSLAALTGVPVERSPATFDEFLERVHPDDRAALHAAVSATAPDGATSHHELRVVWPDGSIHWYDSRWRLVHDEDGAATIVGIARLVRETLDVGSAPRLQRPADVRGHASLRESGAEKCQCGRCRTDADHARVAAGTCAGGAKTASARRPARPAWRTCG